jgi:hypothetical protein
VFWLCLILLLSWNGILNPGDLRSFSEHRLVTPPLSWPKAQRCVQLTDGEPPNPHMTATAPMHVTEFGILELSAQSFDFPGTSLIITNTKSDWYILRRIPNKVHRRVVVLLWHSLSSRKAKAVVLLWDVSNMTYLYYLCGSQTLILSLWYQIMYLSGKNRK